MPNSIRRPRRRPRVHSISFRSLWWVLIREAAFQLLGFELLPEPGQTYHRTLLARRTTSAVRRRVTRHLAAQRKRRMIP